ncbi:MAG: hypothetical protein ACJAV1_002203 [Paraglaciecola sp.]
MVTQVWSHRALELLAERSIQPFEYFSDLQRVFWLKLHSSQSSSIDLYGELEHDLSVKLDNDQVEKLEKFITLWGKSKVSERFKILESLDSTP